MITICPLTTSSCAASSRWSWESAAMGLEYSFMGDARWHRGQITEDNRNYGYDQISVLNLEGKPNSQKREVQG